MNTVASGTAGLDPAISDKTACSGSTFKDISTNTRNDTIYNWSRVTPIALKSQVRYVRSEREVVDLVKRIPEKSKLRACSTMLSFEKISTIPSTDSHSVVIDISGLSGLLSITKDKKYATFWAGTSVDNIISILGEYDLQMGASPGVIGIQKIGGAISTGTHGQGLQQSSYGDITVSMRVVLPNGDLVIVGHKGFEPSELLKLKTHTCGQNQCPNTPETCTGPDSNLAAQATHRPDLPLEAFTLSMGLLGVITQVTIKVVPRKIYYCEKLNCSFEEFEKNYLKWNQENEFIKAWWFPETNYCHVWLSNVATEKLEDYYLKNRKDDKTLLDLESMECSGLNETIEKYLKKMGRDTKSTTPEVLALSPHEDPMAYAIASDANEALEENEPPKSASGDKIVHPPQFRTLTRFANPKNVIGFIHQIFCKGIPVPQINCEVSVPISEFKSALNDLKGWVDASELFHYPFIFRATGKSTSWLSQSPGPSVQIGSLVYISEDGTVRADAMKTMYDFQKILASHLGLPHLGKHFIPDLFHDNFLDPKLCPNLNKFMELRQKIDPHRKLVSAFLESVWPQFSSEDQTPA